MRATMHFDNSKVVKEKMSISGFTRTKHPPSGPDLAPCDFSFFGSIKEKLKKTVFGDEEEPAAAMQGIKTAIPMMITSSEDSLYQIVRYDSFLCGSF
jgi:hypothetical protein